MHFILKIILDYIMAYKSVIYFKIVNFILLKRLNGKMELQQTSLFWS